MVISTKIQEMLRGDLLGPFESIFPKIDNINQGNKRDRTYNEENTLMTMVMTATQEDRTLQNSVHIFRNVFKKRVGAEQKKEEKILSLCRKEDERNDKPKRGRPRKHKSLLQKSKQKDISLNTASYTVARQRLSKEKVLEAYQKSRYIELSKKCKKWHGREVYIADGTYLQLQDTPELRAKYTKAKSSDRKFDGYPQALIEGLIHQESGCLHDFELSGRKVSELELVYPILERLPPKSLILADDLYNTYALFSMAGKLGLDLIVPAKRKRNYKVIEKIESGDEIIEIKRTQRPDWMPTNEEMPETIRLRRICYENPQSPNISRVLMTTILEKNIDKTSIILKYMTRWDVEISIRELKTIMGINVVRSKSHDMVYKEITTAFIAYNLIRKLIHEASQPLFPPDEDIFQIFYSYGQGVLMDKLGRVYNRWSPGRHRNSDTGDAKPLISREARQKIFEKNKDGEI